MTDHAQELHAPETRPIMIQSESRLTPAERDYFLDLFRTLVTARAIDRKSDELVRQGYGFFHVSGAGHEATAALARHLTDEDYLHLHYRDKALMLRRGLTVRQFFLSLLCKQDSHSAGRQMPAHFSDAQLRILSLVGPVGNNALQAVGVAAAIQDRGEQALVICAVGDGTTQQGEFLEAVAEAARQRAAVLFLIEDNGFAISTRTRGRTFFSRDGSRELFGVPIRRIDGTDVVACDRAFASAVGDIRSGDGPQIVVMHVSRLSDHTNADDQERYRDLEEVATDLATHDPTFLLQDRLLREGVELDRLKQLCEEIAEQIEVEALRALEGLDPTPEPAAKAPFPDNFHEMSEYRGHGDATVTMRDALNRVLHQRLASDPHVVLFGEDVEDPKGDVFGVTRNLSTAFPGRVKNSPLSESTIVGTSVGRALAGQRPVAFLQFADFLPLAWNQIISEMGSMYWRTRGDWQCAIIVMITCGGYRPGLGPFHAQSLESVAAHTPGVDVVMPSTAGDAAGLLNAAFESNRPTLFFYPKSCLNVAELGTSADMQLHFVPLGCARHWKRGNELTIVSWGNPLMQCRRAAERLEDEGVGVDLIDLRSLSPWDASAVIDSCERTGRLLVVHEDNLTCGFGAEVAATVAERAAVPVRIRRVARPDTFIPCHFGNQLGILPSARSILVAGAGLLDLDLQWIDRNESDSGDFIVEAIGSGPSDDEVIIVKIHVAPGQKVSKGMLLAEVESTKSIVEIAATANGTVIEILQEEDAVVPVGTPLIVIRPDRQLSFRKPVTQETMPECRLVIRPKHADSAAKQALQPQQTVVLCGIAEQLGSRIITNAELLGAFPGWTEEDVVKRTGVRSRRWVGDREDLLTLAVEASRRVLQDHHFDIEDVGLAIVATTTPDRATPSLACRILAQLQSTGTELQVPAMDINAACSGYLYALQIAWDHVQAQPKSAVLVVTAEVLSPLIDPHDADTVFLFGDAATATLLAGARKESRSSGPLQLSRPVLDGEPESGDSLSVPLCGPTSFISMDGQTVFRKAVLCMTRVMNEACRRERLRSNELECIIPHQANLRILQAIAKRMDAPVFKYLEHVGNTSSCTIPLALQRFLSEDRRQRQPIGLCAFGGGFTSAAAIAYSTGLRS